MPIWSFYLGWKEKKDESRSKKAPSHQTEVSPKEGRFREEVRFVTKKRNLKSFHESQDERR